MLASVSSEVSEFWQPSEKDIDELEDLLRKFLEQREKSGLETPPKDAIYHRQYVGIVSKGKLSGAPTRLIYGNFCPDSVVKSLRSVNESKQAMLVCDGGPVFWGIVFRVSTKTFEEIHFNGLG